MTIQGPDDVPLPKLSAALHRLLIEREIEVQAYQPIHTFRKGERKHPSVPEPGDPWSVGLFRMGERSWGPGAMIGRARADSLEDAIRAALPPDDLRGSMSRLEAALDGLVAVLRG